LVYLHKYDNPGVFPNLKALIASRSSSSVISPSHKSFCTDINLTLLIGKKSIQLASVSGDGGD
jgi:hypothetical protein